MAIKTRSRTTSVGLSALNVVAHPHTTKLYIDAFNAAFNSQPKEGLKLRRDINGLVRNAFPIHENHPEDGLEGEIIRFTELDASEAWYNVDKGKAASPSERKEIVIPANLRPKLKTARYVFFPKEHRIIFMAVHPTDSFSPNLAAKLFVAFFANRQTPEPQITMTIEQSRQALQEILAIFNLRKLDIFVKRPNADVGAETQEALLDELEQQNACEMEVDLVAASPEGLKPNRRNKALAEIAVSNGYVEASGRDENGKKIHINTQDRPATFMFQEHLDRIDIVAWFRQKAQAVVAKLTGRKSDEA